MKIITSILLVYFLFSQAVMALPTAKFTLLVTDENDLPIENAETRLSFMMPKSSGWGGKTIGVTGLTNKDGYFTGEHSTEAYMVYSARKEGYYSSGHKFLGFTGIRGILGFRKWQPWNPTLKVVLKKKVNPIPMYAYSTGTSPLYLPEFQGSIGYDLIKHDWVSPYGKGITADFLFKVSGEYKDRRNYHANLLVQFSNQTDGLQPFKVDKSNGSSFISDYHAPLSGYLSDLIESKENTPGKRSTTSYDEDIGNNYYFRVRCVESKESSCMYGKLYGRIEFSPLRTLGFHYFLNPTPGDTNVEFDPTQNLFNNLDYEPQEP